MTVFYLSENSVCRELMTSFDFYDEANLESISGVLKELSLSYADEQIGFIIPSQNNDFCEEVKEFLEKSELKADYFFAIIVCGKKSSDSSRKFFELCQKYNINLKYLDCVLESENKQKLKDKSISFRCEIGMFVSKINGIDWKNKVIGILEGFSSKIEKIKK